MLFRSVVSGGFPCQDISAAGKGAGIDGERSGMWKHMARIICEVKPRYVYVENSPMLTSRGLDVVLKDLATMGFDAEWGVFSAAQVGAPHLRKRIWIIAKRNKLFSHSLHNRDRWRKQQSKSVEKKIKSISNATSIGLQGQRKFKQSINSKKIRKRKTVELKYGSSSDFWAVEPRLGRVADGVANRVDRLKAIGNGQVPLCAATAWRLLNERL